MTAEAAMAGPAPETPLAAWWRSMTSASPAAIGVIALGANDSASLDAAMTRFGAGDVSVGEVALRNLAGVDTGLVARWTPTRADLFPHAGGAVRRQLTRALSASGLRHAEEGDPRVLFPEARSEIEARMLATLARDPSPRATDLLLAQPARWEGVDPGRVEKCELAPGLLGRLLEPPLVMALGRPNIGKSSLLNALAAREAALVADVPGTTRDHVGLTLTLDGLVVRYLDTPGVHPGEDPDPLTGRATQTAARLVAGADLVLDCRDASEPEGGVTLPEGVASLTVLLRSDRVGSLQPGADAVPTSAATLEGVAELAAAVRNALVPDAALSDTRPWRFWQPA